MIDAVLSYHMNPQTCGVAKFNHLLAKKLGVPLAPLHSFHDFSCPLVSVKFSEDISVWPGNGMAYGHPFQLFAHDCPPLSTTTLQHGWLDCPSAVYAANETIARQIRPRRSDVITGFCPSTLQGNPTRATLNVLTFGMAHKLKLSYYEKLKTLLDGSGQDYTVSVSTAVHEGSPWDAVSEAGEKLRAIFQDKTRVLGYLADDALAKELQDCSAVAMFFDPALRANNTTFWSAMDAGAIVITNLDDDSPSLLAEDHAGKPAVQTWADINRMAQWPSALLESLRSGRCRPTRPCGYTWDDLLLTMGVAGNLFRSMMLPPDARGIDHDA